MTNDLSEYESMSHPNCPVPHVWAAEVEPSTDTDSDGLLQVPITAPSMPNHGPSLPWLLQLLFGLNGATLSILTLPLMYIVNTRAQIPLPYLPTYGAIAFLPYSLKPIYACMINISKKHGIPRSVLFMSLLIGNSLTLILYTLIPPGGIMCALVVAFCRGVTDSCAELCLGLTMIDHARRLGLKNDGRNSESDSNNDNVDSSSYRKAVSTFQAQAATSRNIGSLLGSLLTCLLFLERRWASDSHGGNAPLSGGVANGLFIFTALLQILGAFTTVLFRSDFLVLERSHHQYPRSLAAETASFMLLQQDDNVCVDEQKRECVNGDEPFSGEAKLQEDERSHPSYASLEDYNDQLDRFSATDSNLIEVSDDLQRAEQTPAKWGNAAANCFMIVAVQTVLVILALKEPMSAWLSYLAWEILVVSLVFAVAMTALALYCNNWVQSCHRIGLFLLLKNALPSDAMIVSSFFYSLFELQPLSLQVLSFLEMGVTSLSSWSYNKLWSKYSSGRSFTILIGGMAVMSSLASLLNILVHQAHKRDASLSSYELDKVLGLAILAKFVCTFVNEWAFLPEIVLATTSLTVSGLECNCHESHEGLLTALPHQPSASLLTSASEPIGDTGDGDTSNTEEKIAIEYGTLVSCIDFGDQLGSLAVGPLVSMLDLSRDNDFQNLDHLIVFCAVASMVGSLAILPLLGKKT
jgi:hypothetical protein